MGRKKANFGATKPRSETSLFLTDALQWRGNWAKMGRNGAKISFFNMIKKYHFFFFWVGIVKIRRFPRPIFGDFGRKLGGSGANLGEKSTFSVHLPKTLIFAQYFVGIWGKFGGKWRFLGSIHPQILQSSLFGGKN